jgi:hypothetical protein
MPYITDEEWFGLSPYDQKVLKLTLHDVDNQLRLRADMERALQEEFPSGWFSIAFYTYAPVGPLIFYDADHAKNERYTQTQMRAVVKRVYETTDALHRYTSINFHRSDRPHPDNPMMPG